MNISSRSSYQNIFRWIFFIPLAIIMYGITKFCVTWTFSYINSEMVLSIDSISDFGEYHYIGPFFLFIRESFATSFGIYSGVYLAPNHKFLVLYGFVVLWMIILLFEVCYLGLTISSVMQNIEVFLRYLIDLLSLITGVAICILYFIREEKEIFY